MRLTVLIAAAAAVLVAAGPAAAQYRGDYRAEYRGGYNTGYGHERARSNWAPSAFDWRSQLDRSGDYRCDQFWDANRNDCGARWRDQRGRSSYGYRNVGYGRDYGRYGYGYDTRRRGYGGYGGYGSGYGGYAGQTTAYFGAYGRPDLVSGGGGHSGYAGSRDPRRVDWCRSAYRSYDPSSGYYRAYSGRLVFCG